jgi:hypothetical protein
MNLEENSKGIIKHKAFMNHPHNKTFNAKILSMNTALSYTSEVPYLIGLETLEEVNNAIIEKSGFEDVEFAAASLNIKRQYNGFKNYVITFDEFKDYVKLNDAGMYEPIDNPQLKWEIEYSSYYSKREVKDIQLIWKVNKMLSGLMDSTRSNLFYNPNNKELTVRGQINE